MNSLIVYELKLNARENQPNMKQFYMYCKDELFDEKKTFLS
jgi:hypothetical protein